MKKHKFKVGDSLWEATQWAVMPVDVTELVDTLDGEPVYIVVEHNGSVDRNAEVLEQYLFTSKKDALHYALQINDNDQLLTNSNIRDNVTFLERLQQASQRMRHLLYEEQIQEYMRNKNECLS